jgi:hypothetical protein
MKLPSNVLNPLLYRYAYDKVTRIYGTQTSAYRSMAIVKAYKQLGGKYAGTQRGGALQRWLRERWTMVRPYVLEQKVVPCGNHARRKHACRPLVRVTQKTPMTVKEVLAKHGKAKAVRLAHTKHTLGSENTRIDWNAGKYKIQLKA